MNRSSKVFAMTLTLLGSVYSVTAGAKPALPTVQPSEVAALGFSQERLDRMDQLLQQRVDKGELGGVVVLIARHGKIVHFKPIGYSDIDTKKPMEKDSIFRLYSMTKPVIATGLMMLFEQGKFKLDDPVSKYLPEFKDIKVLRTPDSPVTDTVDPVREPTIHDLFRHTAGFTGGRPPAGSVTDAAYLASHTFDPDVSLQSEVDRIAKVPLRFQPGTTFEYGLGLDVAARLIEVISGQSLRDYLHQNLFDPLGMKDTDYFVNSENASRLVSISWPGNDGKLESCTPAHCFEPFIYVEEPDLLQAYYRPHASTPGSYGLVGTAADYFRFAQMLQNGGEFDGKRYLSPAMVRYMEMDHLGPVKFTEGAGQSYGLGLGVVTDPAASGEPASKGTAFWSGYGGTEFWMDPQEDLTVIVMTQHMHAPEIWDDLSKIKSMVYGTLSK